MIDHWLDITDIPAQGREFSFEGPELWEQAWSEYHMDVRPDRPLSAKFFVVPDKRGAFVRGSLQGRVVTTCDRCAEEAPVEINQDFDLFEELPLEGTEVLEPGLLRRQGQRLELDVGLMLWEEFLLAMPFKPLCQEDCRGLCPHCGANLNLGPCGCQDRPDPRLAPLHGLKIKPD